MIFVCPGIISDLGKGSRQQKQARKSSEDTQVASYARFEKDWAR